VTAHAVLAVSGWLCLRYNEHVEDSMTQLLQKAFAEVSRLPEDEQDAIAAIVLAELSSERRWNELFEKSQDVLVELAEEALAEHRTGKTKRLDPDEL